MILIDTTTTEVVTPESAGGATFEIRSLTGAEFRNVGQVYGRGEDGAAKACAYAIVSWKGVALRVGSENVVAPLTTANIDRLPPKVIDDVASAIFKRSRVSEEDKSGAAISSANSVG